MILLYQSASTPYTGFTNGVCQKYKAHISAISHFNGFLVPKCLASAIVFLLLLQNTSLCESFAEAVNQLPCVNPLLRQ